MGSVRIQAVGNFETGIDHSNSWYYGNRILTIIEPAVL